MYAAISGKLDVTQYFSRKPYALHRAPIYRQPLFRIPYPHFPSRMSEDKIKRETKNQLDRFIFMRRGCMPSLIDLMAMARLKWRWPLARELLEDPEEPLEELSAPPPPSSSSSDVSIDVKTPQRTPITKNMMMNKV